MLLTLKNAIIFSYRHKLFRLKQLSDLWDRFREQPRNRVDEFVFALALIACDNPASLQRAANSLCPGFSVREIEELVDLNLDMVRPADLSLSIADWSRFWKDGLCAGLRAIGSAAKSALFERVLAPGQGRDRIMYFSCLLSVLSEKEKTVQTPDLQRLADGLCDLERWQLFEETDLNDWMREFARAVPEGGEAVLDVLKSLWFSSETPELMRIEDYSDADHEVFSLASALVYFGLWQPGYAAYIATDLKRLARNDFFPVTLNPDDPEDNPPEGAGRRQKLQAIVGAAFAMLDREAGDAAWLEICLSYANSPADDTRDAFAQWRPVVAGPFPRATALIDRAVE